MPTRDEIEKLKAQWRTDPCWDIEDTDGFEEHKAELREYRERMEVKWAKQAQAREEADPAYQARQNLIQAAEDRNRDWVQSMNYHLRVAQVQAVLALVDRLDRMTTSDGSAVRTMSRLPFKS